MNRLKHVYFRANENATPVLLEEYSYTMLDNENTQKTCTKYLNDTETATTIYTYDYAGRLISQQNPDGTTSTSIYNPNGTTLSSTGTNNGTTYYHYDGLNRLTEQWIAFESVSSTVMYAYTKTEYDKTGRVIASKLGKEKVVLWGLPTTYSEKTSSYYLNGKLKSIVDNEGRQKDYFYDEDGNLKREDVYVDASTKNTTEYANNCLGKPDTKKVYVRKGDIEGNSFEDNSEIELDTQYTYDGNGNIKTEQTPDKVTKTYFYDNMDRQTGVSQPGRDEYGAAVVITSSTLYNWAGKPLVTTDANGKVTNYAYNQMGLVETITDADNGITAYYYDRAGRKIFEVSPKYYNSALALDQMNRIQYTYDLMDRLKTKSEIYLDPTTGNWTSYVEKAYKYDNGGNVSKELDALGYEAGTGTTVDQKINTGYGKEYTYNLAGKLITMLDPVSKERGLNYTTLYDYDPSGRKISETNAIGVITKYKYDSAGNITSVDVWNPENETEKNIETNGYDFVGNILTKEDGNGNITTFEYNAYNNVRKVVYPGDASIPSNTVIYQYDEMGNLKKSLDSLGGVDLYSYDNQGRQLSHTREKEDGTEAITTSVAYDKNGNKRFETDGNNVTTEYVYDNLNRVFTETKGDQTTTYGYDKNGNLETQKDWLGNVDTNVFDPLNRLIEKIDPNGKRVQKLEYNHNNVQIYSWDALDGVRGTGVTTHFCVDTPVPLTL